MTDLLSLPLLDVAPQPVAVDQRAALAAKLRARVGRPLRYHLVTLGCPKNTVDSETFERRLRALGCQPAPARQADVLVANTCGFIEQSQQESIGAILDLAAARRPGQALIAAGCLVSLNRDELAATLPEVDGFYDPRQWGDTVAAVAVHGLLPDVTVADLEAALAAIDDGADAAPLASSLFEQPAASRVRQRSVAGRARTQRRVSVPDIPEATPTSGDRVSAYLKISDGCNAPCTFCIIPQIKGRFTSIGAGELVAQARELRAEGVRELVLVAQDSTAYGEDLGRRDALPDLLRLLAEAVPDVWLRLMYAYPGRVSDRLIETMATLPQVVPYLDVPLQHGSVATLRRMRRPANMTMVRRMIADLRAAMPDLALRTSLIAGFPGETEAEFEELLAFVEETRFDRLGVFTYSRQSQAVSHDFPDQVAERVKQARQRQVLALQQAIALAKQQTFIGRELTMLVEGSGDGAAGEGPVVVGRTFRDAPEVDGLAIARGVASSGEFVRLRVDEATPYDLIGTIVGPADPFAGAGVGAAPAARR